MFLHKMLTINGTKVFAASIYRKHDSFRDIVTKTTMI